MYHHHHHLMGEGISAIFSSLALIMHSITTQMCELSAGKDEFARVLVKFYL